MTKMIRQIALVTFILAAMTPVIAQEKKDDNIDVKYLSRFERAQIVEDWKKRLSKTMSNSDRYDERKEVIINGNQIRVLITNFGSISTPDADNANADLVWPQGSRALGYAYEFGPLVAAEVLNDDGDTLHIVDDGFLRSADGDFEPGTTNRWGWQPRKGFSDPNNPELAHFSDTDDDLDGKPDSWPETYFNPALGRYVWPAFLGDDATTPDEEVFYILDDFANAEFRYFPDPDDTTKRGLGLEIQIRIFQFNNALAEDIIFLVYTVTNVGKKPLNRIYLGMFGDPHVGGPNDFADDNANFISKFDESFPFKARNMLYAFDEDGRGDLGKRTGFFGYKFLESPGIDNDGVDNDNDGLIDESSFNDAGVEVFGPVGIYGDDRLHWSGDEDGDWNPEFDDVGVDGIAGTQDFGEGDGKPNQLFYLDENDNSILDPGEPTSEFRQEGMRFFGGEPNFGFLDIAESDQLGLTSFNALLFGGNNRPKNDDLMWEKMSTPNQHPDSTQPEIAQESDNVFIYSSGPFALKPGESQRFSIALLLGDDLTDLVQNAVISQDVFEADYRFAKPPRKPNLVAVPGDGKVTLYWDTGAESSFDPFIQRANPDNPEAAFDFEGYKIYRSRDFSFNDTKIITDSKGIAFLSKPLEDNRGVPAVFDIKDNGFQGLSEIEYTGRGVRFDLGNNTGLVHTYVDSNNITNGITYFYAVTAYDHGDVRAKIPPSETQRIIQRDAISRKFKFDINTAMVVPGPPAANREDAHIVGSEDNAAQHTAGLATGKVVVQILDPLKVVDGKTYEIVFDSLETRGVVYSVIDPEPRTAQFVGRGTKIVRLPGGQIVPGSVTITAADGTVVDPSRYTLEFGTGRIQGNGPGDLTEGEVFTISYKFAPVFESVARNGEDSNPVFDGLRVFAFDEENQLDPERSGFKISQNNSNLIPTAQLARVGRAAPFPADFEMQFVDYDTAATGELLNAPDTSIITKVAAPFKIIETATGRQVDFFINESNVKYRNKRWDYLETVVILNPNSTRPTDTVYEVTFDVPKDTLYNATGDSIIEIRAEQPVYPGEGDVFFFFSQKPFSSKDRYTFETAAPTFPTQGKSDALSNVYVVPNPYIAFSASEISAPRPGERDDRRLEFRNLPHTCTIRIYTISGDLVATIEKNDPGSTALWNLLSSEAQRIAYGVYIYHVEAPGIGEKLGRFAVIK